VIVRYLGVYDADGGLVGEVRYVVGHLLGTAECALCDITHSLAGRRRAWDRMVAGLGVPFDLRHRNELTPAEREAVAAPGLPVVVAELEDGRFVPLLDRKALARCGGDVAAFTEALGAAAGPYGG
jgi:hypothetical protein